MGRNDELPFVLLDADEAGRKFANALKDSLYRGQDARVLSIGDFVQISNCEVEDLFPQEFIGKIVDRYLEKPSDIDEDLVDTLDSEMPIIPQIENYAAKYGIRLARGWKVDVARRVKSKLLRSKQDVNVETYAKWRELFSALGARQNNSARRK